MKKKKLLYTFLVIIFAFITSAAFIFVSDIQFVNKSLDDIQLYQNHQILYFEENSIFPKFHQVDFYADKISYRNSDKSYIYYDDESQKIYSVSDTDSEPCPTYTTCEDAAIFGKDLYCVLNQGDKYLLKVIYDFDFSLPVTSQKPETVVELDSVIDLIATSSALVYRTDDGYFSNSGRIEIPSGYKLRAYNEKFSVFEYGNCISVFSNKGSEMVISQKLFNSSDVFHAYLTDNNILYYGITSKYEVIAGSDSFRNLVRIDLNTGTTNRYFSFKKFDVMIMGNTD